TMSIHFLGRSARRVTPPSALVSARRPSSPPLTIWPSRVATDDRIAPPWTLTVCAAPPSVSRSVPSPSAKQARLPRNAASTTNAPKLKPWMVAIAKPASGCAGGQALTQHVFWQVASDEHEAAFAFLVGAPRALMIAL